MPFCNSTISAINLGDAFHIPEFESAGLSAYEFTRYRNACHVPMPSGEAWLFQYGIVVFWTVSDDDQELPTTLVTPHIILVSAIRGRYSSLH